MRAFWIWIVVLFASQARRQKRRRRQRHEAPLVGSFPLARNWSLATYKDLDLDVAAFSGLVLVTGPQRSGTTYTSEVIARVLGAPLVNEQAYATHNVTKFLQVLDSTTNTVVQCPAMSHLLHRLPRPKRRGVVVFMARDCWDVALSERRIAHKVRYNNVSRTELWTCSPLGALGEHAKYAKEPDLRHWYNPHHPICIVKQLAWRYFQHAALQRRGWKVVTLDYDSLVGEPTWRAVKNRTSFLPHQTYR